MNKYKSYVTVDEVETQQFDWGTLQWMSEPRVTGFDRMVTGLVTLQKGQGHAKHNHPGIEEILYIMEGTGEQTIFYEDGTEDRRTVGPGQLIFLEKGQFHSTYNVAEEPLKILAIYATTGPEVGMRNDPGCTLIPPRK